MEQITIGIVAGLITTFIVVFIRQVWVDIIEPWYENRLYQDAEIEGKWKGSYKETDGSEELVDIKRTGHKMFMSLIVNNNFLIISTLLLFRFL